MNKIVGQPYPYALVVMSLVVLLVILQTIILATPPISKDLTFSQNQSAKIYFDTKVF
jgi:hypothetical protein